MTNQSFTQLKTLVCKFSIAIARKLNPNNAYEFLNTHTKKITDYFQGISQTQKYLVLLNICTSVLKSLYFAMLAFLITKKDGKTVLHTNFYLVCKIFIVIAKNLTPNNALEFTHTQTHIH